MEDDPHDDGGGGGAAPRREAAKADPGPKRSDSWRHAATAPERRVVLVVSLNVDACERTS